MVRLKERRLSPTRIGMRCFNSTMVRLKAEIANFHCFCCTCFNSTMVRLKVEITLRQRPHVVFQFHNGSIKRILIYPFTIFHPQFQFHNGSIKRLPVLLLLLLRLPFQFHNGSIKRGYLSHLIGHDLRFNSTMVRLKEDCPNRPSTKCYVSIPQWFD